MGLFLKLFRVNFLYVISKKNPKTPIFPNQAKKGCQIEGYKS